MPWLKRFFIGLLIFSGALLVTFVLVLNFYTKDLPDLDSLTNYQPKLVTTIYSADNQVIATYAKERRVFLPPEKMPPNIVNAFVAAEDDEFFSHRGINPVTILRAAIKNFQAGYTVQGGSTITQQVAKSFLLTPEKSYKRKIKEVILAFRIEKALSKDQILNLYLNHIFLGQNAYGVEAAALTYFGKTAAELSVAEAAILAGLPRAPSRDNPAVDPKAAKQRQNYVLGRMLATNKISPQEHKDALAEEIKIVNTPPGISSPAPYLAEYARRAIIEKFGEAQFESGLSVYTTVDLKKQLAAQDAVNIGLRAADKRMGLRRPEKDLNTQEKNEYLAKQHKELTDKFYNYRLLKVDGQIESPVPAEEPTPIEIGKNYKGVVLGKDKKRRGIIVGIGNRQGVILPQDYQWVFEANPDEVYAEKIVRNPYNELDDGDLITVQPRFLDDKELNLRLEQEPVVQGALIAYRVEDGALDALVGGYDFSVTGSHFNRALQAVRQPGSTFKAVVYGAGVEAGLTPSTIVVDSPIVYRDQGEQSEVEKVWRPENFSEKFYGDTLLRNALAYSRNIPTIKLLQHLRVQTVIDYARKLGVKSALNADLSLALGSSGVTPSEMVHVFGCFAGQGRRLDSHFMTKVVDWQGKTIFEYAKPEPTQLISPQNAYLMTSLLKSVVDYGTATQAQELKRPVAGKTGTTNDYKDAWFLGYSPQLVAGVWVGFDEDRPIGRNETGTRTALPIWMQYMNAALSGVDAKDFEVPEGIIQVKVDSQTGDLPNSDTKKTLVEVFVDGNAPGQPAKESLTPGEVKVLRTQVVTGNPDLGSSSGATQTGQPSNDEGIDEFMREEL